jgi:hypothetical protein
MRANSFSFIEIAENARDIFGEMSRSSAWIASLLWAPARHQKIDETWSSASPPSLERRQRVLDGGRLGIA